MKGLKKEKLEIILFILFVMSGLGYAYTTLLFLPEWAVVQSVASKLDAQQKNYHELLTYQKNQSGLQQEIKTLGTKVIQLNAQLPNRLDKPQFMVGLYTLAKQHSLIPQTIAFEQAQNKGTYQEMGMSFSCSGKAADILTLIQDLQFGGSQRLAIKSITLSVSQGIMRAELKLTAYVNMGTSNDLTKKPDFMNSPIGVDSPAKIFQP
ncbi:MAG TPA: type 4a pilus biogenesis protein PilO [Desulfosporosinus sp.]